MNELHREIVETIRAEGPISFARYMELALYHPEYGYYTTRVPGKDADYYTSPTLTPWFGRLIARLISRMKVELRGAGFDVIEIGGGSGQLAASVASVIEGSRWTFVEPFTHPREAQRRAVDQARGTFAWVSTLPVDPVVGCIIANEVIDNFPCRQFEVTDQGVSEVLVDCRGSSLQEVLKPLDSDFLPSEPLAHLEPGDRFEFRPGIDEWITRCAKSLDRGYLLIIDYGDEEPYVWLNRPAGTVVTYAGGRLGLNPLASPGSADVTAHVNFTQLRNAASAVGFSDFVNMSQREALHALGLGDEVSALKEAIEAARSEGDFQKMAAEMAELSRLTALAQPGAMGDFRMFVASKGATSRSLFE